MHSSRIHSLIKKLDHQDPSKRRAAAEALAEGDERVIYPLIKALRDENLGVQDAAIHSLMGIKDESTAYMVIPLLREDAFLRNTALLILKEIGREAVPLLEILLKDRDDDVRKFALDLINDIGWCNYPDKLVNLLESDPNANVRAAAAKTLGMLQHIKALPQLIKSLKDEEWVSFSVIEALANLKDESAIDAIAALLKNHSESIRFAAIEALGSIGSQSAGIWLINHFETAGGIEKEATVISLVRIGAVPSLPGMSDSLMKMLRDGEWDEKSIAIKGLLAIKEEEAVSQIVDAAGSLDLSKPDDEARLVFIKEAIRDFGCIEPLFDILSDPTMKYRGKVIAIEAIGDMGCINAIPTLIDLLNSEYRDVRRTSMESLSRIESEEARDCFIKAISDHDSHVRKTAVSALGRIGDKTAFEPLMNMLESEQYSDVIDEFVKALININATLFLSRVKDFNSKVIESAEMFSAVLNMEIKC